MDFLTGKGVYHGDLAVRNILLIDTLDIKISDFGLSRRIYSNLENPRSLGINEESLPLPIRWLPLEVLTKHQIVPIKTDVWSFGVTMWEIFAAGRQPYWEGIFCPKFESVQRIIFYFVCTYTLNNYIPYFSGIDIPQLVNDLTLGIRLPNPAFCPKAIADLIETCFRESPEKRPDFDEIKSKLNTAFNRILLKNKTRADVAKNDYHLVNFNRSAKMQSQYITLIKENKREYLIQQRARKNTYLSKFIKNEKTSDRKEISGTGHENCGLETKNDIYVDMSSKLKASDPNCNFTDDRKQENIENTSPKNDSIYKIYQQRWISEPILFNVPTEVVSRASDQINVEFRGQIRSLASFESDLIITGTPKKFLSLP